MGLLIYGSLIVFMRPGGTVKLRFSVAVVLYTVFLRPSGTVELYILSPKPCPKTLVKNLTKNLDKIGHADHVL